MSSLQEELANMYPVKEEFKVRLASASASNSDESKKKWKISLISGLLFALVASPMLYKLVDGLLSNVTTARVCDENGCPTPLGLALHTVVFVLIVRAMMK